jgi:MoxR-like ATPase
VGKSQIVAQVASDLGWQFVNIRAVQLDPVDLRGLPRISADQAMTCRAAEIACYFASVNSAFARTNDFRCDLAGRILP